MSVSPDQVSQLRHELWGLQRFWWESAPSCDLYLFYDSVLRIIRLEKLFVPPTHRRQGLGGTMLRNVITLADAYRAPVRLVVSERYDVAQEVLVSFYQSFEFALTGDETSGGEPYMFYLP